MSSRSMASFILPIWGFSWLASLEVMDTASRQRQKRKVGTLKMENRGIANELENRGKILGK